MNNAFLQFVARYGPGVGEEGPIRLVREVFAAEPDDWQAQVLRAFGRGERRISVRSAHGVGKTAIASWLVWVMLLTRYPQKSVATAPTSGQLSGALLPEVKTWGKKLPPLLQELFEVKQHGIYLKANPSGSFFEARTSRAEKPEALQGVHSDHTLLIGDEASGIPDPVFESSAGSMSGHNATTLLIGNPVRTSGFFWDTHTKLRDMWFTLRVGHEESPRISKDFVEDIARRYGRDSNAFRVRCLGEFPLTEDDKVIPFEIIEAARGRDIQERPDAPRVWGLDVARFGSDRSVLVERTNRSASVLDMWGEADLMETAGRVFSRYNETLPSQQPTIILVDAIGMGGGVVDRLQELGLPVRGINVGEAASLSTQFRRARSELWWRGREWLERRDVTLKVGKDREDPNDILAAELGWPSYKYESTGHILVEPKSETKKNHGKSPDAADAFILTFAENLVAASFGASGSMKWGSAIHRGLVVT